MLHHLPCVLLEARHDLLNQRVVQSVCIIQPDSHSLLMMSLARHLTVLLVMFPRGPTSGIVISARRQILGPNRRGEKTARIVTPRVTILVCENGHRIPFICGECDSSVVVKTEDATGKDAERIIDEAELIGREVSSGESPVENFVTTRV